MALTICFAVWTVTSTRTGASGLRPRPPGVGRYRIASLVGSVRIQPARSRALGGPGTAAGGGAGFPDVAADSAVSALPDGGGGGAGRGEPPSFAPRPRQPQGCLPGRPRTGGAC